MIFIKVQYMRYHIWYTRCIVVQYLEEKQSCVPFTLSFTLFLSSLWKWQKILYCISLCEQNSVNKGAIERTVAAKEKHEL